MCGQAGPGAWWLAKNRRDLVWFMAGAKDSWSQLAKSLKAEIDEKQIEDYRGTVSLPFEPGEHRRAAVKIVDDPGVDSLNVMELV